MELLTAERVSTDLSDNYVFQRSLLAYLEAARLVSGKVLEIGTGSGYGIQIIAPKTSRFVTIDKYPLPTAQFDPKAYPQVEVVTETVPPLGQFATNSFDYVIIFQVIEHIRNDHELIAEIHRILKPGGQLIISTPNREMSLTRNPWHVREYTLTEFSTLLKPYFESIDARGIFGNDKICSYYEENRKGVARITRFDIFRFQYWLPRPLLRLPYDLLNRLNRRKILHGNDSLVATISHTDYFLAPATAKCFDLFYIATKSS